MPNDRLVELFDHIGGYAPAYAIYVSQLSDSIEKLEAFLNSLPARIEVEVWSDGVGLRYARESKGVWQLQTAIHFEDVDDHAWARLAECGVELKIAATVAFEPLLQKYAEIQDERLSKLKAVGPLVSRLISVPEQKEEDSDGFPN